MGYTEEIYRVKKENVNNVRSLTPKELFEFFKENVKPGDSDLVDDLEEDNSYQIWFPSLLNALDGIRVFDFGKDYENADDMHNNGEPLSFELITQMDVPSGSGLGTSSTLVVAILGAFTEWLRLPLGKYDIAHYAYEPEYGRRQAGPICRYLRRR